MKKLLFIAAAISSLSLASCQKNSGNGGDGTDYTQAQEVLLSMYPNATDITWTTKNGYYVADFNVTQTYTVSGKTNSAWFDNVGEWFMTETEIAFTALPEAVKQAFASSEYASFRVDDEVDMLSRTGVETVYVIEVEGVVNGSDTDIDLYYDATGVLVKKVIGQNPDYDYGDYIPSKPAESIQSFISQKYPGSRIVDIDKESNGTTEVEIVDGRVCRDVIFDASGNWSMTKTDVAVRELPADVTNALAASSYASARIDDAELIDTPSGSYYLLELKTAQGEVNVKVDASGQVSEVQPDAGTSITVNKEIESYINQNFSGAVILEQEYDDGFIKVEILHENLKKEIYFTGSYKWAMSKWDINVANLPDAVKTAIANSAYDEARIDDAEYVKTETTEYYKVDLKSGSLDVEMTILSTGEVINTEID